MKRSRLRAFRCQLGVHLRYRVADEKAVSESVRYHVMTCCDCGAGWDLLSMDWEAFDRVMAKEAR